MARQYIKQTTYTTKKRGILAILDKVFSKKQTSPKNIRKIKEIINDKSDETIGNTEKNMA